MDKYMRLMAIKGLIMSMDEQIHQRFQKDNLPENIQKIIVDKYYDAILEQLSETEKAKEDVEEIIYNIIINGREYTHIGNIISHDDVKLKLSISYSKKVTITYSNKDKNLARGILLTGESVDVKNDMIFNILDASKA